LFFFGNCKNIRVRIKTSYFTVLAQLFLLYVSLVFEYRPGLYHEPFPRRLRLLTPTLPLEYIFIRIQSTQCGVVPGSGCPRLVYVPRAPSYELSDELDNAHVIIAVLLPVGGNRTHATVPKDLLPTIAEYHLAIRFPPTGKQTVNRDIILARVLPALFASQELLTSQKFKFCDRERCLSSTA